MITWSTYHFLFPGDTNLLAQIKVRFLSLAPTYRHWNVWPTRRRPWLPHVSGVIFDTVVFFFLPPPKISCDAGRCKRTRSKSFSFFFCNWNKGRKEKKVRQQQFIYMFRDNIHAIIEKQTIAWVIFTGGQNSTVTTRRISLTLDRFLRISLRVLLAELKFTYVKKKDDWE